MQCQTVREGVECFFWKKDGCSHDGGTCNEVSEKCEGCSHIISFGEQRFCKRYPNPESKWVNVECNLATHVVREEKVAEKKPINPLKASKRMARGR